MVATAVALAANLCAAATLAMSNLNMSPASCFNIISAWSKAGVGTSIVLETDPASGNEHSSSSTADSTAGLARRGTRIVFDIGATPVIDDTFKANIVIISHGHIDHFGAMFNHARAHSVLYGGSTPTYYVPSALVEQLELSRQAMSSLDAANEGTGSRTESLLKMNIIGVDAGDEIELKQRKIHGGMRLILRAFAVDHGGHPALGYVVATRTAPGLKPEYKGLPGDEIRKLVKSGVLVKGEPVDMVQVAYTGDTSAKGLMYHEEDGGLSLGKGNDQNLPSLSDDGKWKRSIAYRNQAFRAPLILCELTFLDLSMRDLASRRGHMHILDVAEVLSSHGWDVSGDCDVHDGTSAVRKVVFLHLSSRHAPARNALDMIADQLPFSIAKYCHVAISSIMAERAGKESELFRELVREDGCISLSDYLVAREAESECS